MKKNYPRNWKLILTNAKQQNYMELITDKKKISDLI